jgi:hypothetical protein
LGVDDSTPNESQDLCRAIYLENGEFLQTLKRLIARNSDNAGTFAAASTWLKKVQSDEQFHNQLANERIHWWGGQLERLVGLIKHMLYKSIGNSCLTWSELQDVLLDIEVSLNNHPLGYQEDDIELPTISFKSLGTDATKPLNFNKRQSPPPPAQCCVPFLVGFDMFWFKQH